MVSGDRRRLKDDETNLDLSYITDSIIAMSFPASGFIERVPFPPSFFFTLLRLGEIQWMKWKNFWKTGMEVMDLWCGICQKE